ncbi:ABC transporter substrate-binding protein [Rhizobium brockwellii]
MAERKKTASARIKGAPEGPYEYAVEQARGSLQNSDLNQFLDFVIALNDESARLFGSRVTQRDMRMAIDLVRSHFSGAPVTKSSLAASSGLSYGTAMRAIETMLESGLIVTRPRTSTGLSYSLHPSGDLISRWHAFSHRGEKLTLREATNPTEPLLTQRGDRSKLDVPAGIIPPPTVLTEALSLGRGLRILVHADTTFIAMSALKRQFELILGVPVAARALGIDQLHAEIVGNSRRSQSRYDIIACDLPWFGEMAHRGRLLPLDRLMQGDDLNCTDIYADALASSRHEGRQFGIPVLTTGEILAYRTDLLSERAVAPPRTSEEVIVAGRKLHDPKRGVSGITWNGGRGTALGHSFIMMMGAFGRPIVDLRRTLDGFDVAGAQGEELRPTFLSEEARQTVAYMRELIAFSPPNILDVTWYERASTYANGHAAMAYSHSLLAHLFETVPQSPAYRKTGYLPHPAGPNGRPIVPVGGYALSSVECRAVEDSVRLEGTNDVDLGAIGQALSAERQPRQFAGERQPRSGGAGHISLHRHYRWIRRKRIFAHVAALAHCRHSRRHFHRGGGDP